MNIKGKFIGVFGAAIMTASMIGGVAAAETATADVNVRVSAPDNGTLAASITGGRFQDVKYRAGSSFQNSSGSFVVTATDTRGVGSGWAVTIAANGDFKDGEKSFPVTGFALQQGSVQGKDNANSNGITPSAIGSMGTNAQTIMNAGKGKGLGVFDDTIQGTVAVPDGTLVGDYKTSLTVTITAGN